MADPQQKSEATEPVDEGREWQESSANEVELVIDDEKPAEEEVPEEFKGLSKAQIVAKLKEVESRKAAESAQGSVFDRLGATLDRIAAAPSPAPAPAAAPAAPEVESWDKTKEKLNEQFVTDPSEAAMKLFTEKLSPMVAQSLMGVGELARQILEKDPEKGPTFKKYASEIDAEVAKQPPVIRLNPKVYELAYKKVVADHVEDIIKDRVNQAVAAAAKPASPEPQPAPHQEGRPGVARPGAKPVVRMTTEEANRLRNMGIDPKDYVEAMGGGR